jgi:hypothetical protein
MDTFEREQLRAISKSAVSLPNPGCAVARSIKAVVWCRSPLSQGLTRAVILDRALLQSIGDSVAASVIDSVNDSVRASAGYSVTDNVRFEVRDFILGNEWDHASLRQTVRAMVRNSRRPGWLDFEVEGGEDYMWDSVGTSVTYAVSASVRDEVATSVCDTLKTSAGGSVEYSVGASVYGAHEAGLIAYDLYFHDVLGLVGRADKLSGLSELAQSAGWALMHRDICWVSERHHILKRDERGRLHSLTGPAVAYQDGFAIHAVHGVRVPANVIDDPGRINVARIDNETNAEVRRIMIERYRQGEEVSGPAAFIRDAGGERLDHDESCGTLWRRDEPIVMVEVVNAPREPDGSFKRYWLRVPPTIGTAREAVAWTFDMPAEEYAPVKQT